MAQYTAGDIAARLGGTVRGDADLALHGVATLARAEAGDLSFIGEARYASQWPTSRAGAALVEAGSDLAPGEGRALIEVAQPDLAMAAALELFAEPTVGPAAGVDRNSVVDPSAEVSEGAAIGPLCHIGPGARIGPRAVLHGSVSIGADSVIGEGCVLWPGVVVRERCTLGPRCVCHPNVVIGGDGFGYRPAQGEHGPYMAKIPHIGTVEIGEDVEIGAGSCIDRGKFAATTLGRGCRIDNLVQIGHNCELGEHVTIAAASALGGSVTLGDWALLGGGVIVRDHVHIGAGAQLAGGSGAAKDVPAEARYAGLPARPVRQWIREDGALRRLPELVKERRGR